MDAITNNPDAPTFENTIVAMERSGKELDRVFTYYGILSSNMSTPEFRAIRTEMAPKISEYRSKILQNKSLFERIKAVYNASQATPLEADQQRVVDLIYNQFAHERGRIGRGIG
jgi:peptidyl-dipeptidase Dcp